MMISPVSDIFVKYLLGREETKDLLLSFINAVLEDSGFRKLIDVQIQNPFNPKTFILDKDTALDIKAIDEAHHLYDIEVQVAGNEMFKSRSLYYWSKLYTTQIKESDDYKLLKPVICINLLDFELIKRLDKYHSVFWITEKDDPALVLTDHLQIHFLELPVFLKKAEKLQNKVDYWLYYFKNEGRGGTDMEIIIKNDEDIQKAHKEYEKFTMDTDLRELYEARLKFHMDQRTLINSAREEGINEGIKEGKIEAALKMKAKGFSIDDISEITGLSIETIKSLD